MLWESLLDGGPTDESGELLRGLDEFVSSLIGARPEPEQVPTAAEMAKALDAIREQGWFELALDRELPADLYFDALSVLHRRTLMPPAPVLEVWSALRLLARLGTPEAAELLDRAVRGSAVPVVAVGSAFDPGDSGWVPFGADVTPLLVTAGSGTAEVVAVPPGDDGRRRVNSVDPTLPSVSVVGGGTRIGRLDERRLATLQGELLVAQSAALSGQAEAMLVATTSHLASREQFGVPIGSFQALRHRAADLATEVYAANRLTRHAAGRLPDHDDPLVLGLLTKAFTGGAALRMAGEAVQLHGGMGFTWEGGVHFGLKRIMHLAMTGPTVGECEERLGAWAVETRELLWAGGIDGTSDAMDTKQDVR